MLLVQADEPSDVASGDTPGVKRAAVRKLAHELGITGLKPEQFKFLTRVHYWAADTVRTRPLPPCCPTRSRDADPHSKITHGPSAEWGENEIDYILFAQVNPCGVVSSTDVPRYCYPIYRLAHQ